MDTNDLGGFESIAAKLTGTLLAAEQQLAKILTSFGHVGSAAKETLSSFDKWGDSAKNYAEKLGVSVTSVSDELLAVNGLFSTSKVFDTFGAGAQKNLLMVSGAASAVNDNLGLIKPILERMAAAGGPAAEVLKFMGDGLSNAADQGQKAEIGFYAMKSASGELFTEWGKGANQISQLGTRTLGYMQNLQNLAVENRTTIDSTIALSQAMAKISPGGTGKVEVLHDDGTTETLDKITAAMRVVTGAGREQKDMTDAISVAYENLGNAQNANIETDQRAVDLFSTMIELQSRMGVTFETSRDALAAVAKEFRNVGDETDGAAKIFDTFGNALRNTGITASASMTIVGDMIKGISDLTVGTKAFLSSQSGGPGGLQGSLQIDEMLRKHDLAGVMNIAQNALKSKFGGRIVTQQEGAEQGGDTAAQYQKQRSMLQSGIFGIGKGTDDQTAGRIIEALKQGNVSGFADTMKTGQAVAGDLAKKGNKLQERSVNILTSMAQILQRQTVAQELSAAAELRRIGGTEGSPKMVDALKKEYDRATSELRGKEKSVDGAKKMDLPGSFNEALKKLRGNPSEELEDHLEGLGQSITAEAKRAKAELDKKMGIRSKDDSTSAAIPVHSVSETRKQDILNRAQKTSHTAPMDKQAATTKEAVSKPTDKEQTVKVMIEVVNDPGKIIKSVSSSNATITKGNNPAPDIQQQSYMPNYGR